MHAFNNELINYNDELKIEIRRRKKEERGLGLVV